MSTFTMTLKEVIASQGGNIDAPGDFDGDLIGLGEYPLFDDSYRDLLNTKIIDHFWNREIGQETVSMFRLALRRKMNEIMPLYNQHYVLSQLEYDPLSTVDIRTLATGNTAGTTHGTGNQTSGSDSKSRTVASSTPQTALSGDEDYADALSDVIGNTTGTGSSVDDRTDTGNRSDNSETKGYQGLPAEMLMRARLALVNVDMMVIGELETLFMLVWNNGDEYTHSHWSY
jgi:hypothetical protein